MSSQGLAAAAEGLNQGFDQGLQAVRQRALLGMQQQQLALQQQQARAGLAEKGIASVDESGNINPVPGFANPGESYQQASLRHAREAKTVPLTSDQAKYFGLPEGTTSINDDLKSLYAEKLKNPDVLGAASQSPGLSALSPSQMGYGPTPAGAATGLGALATAPQSSGSIADRFANGSLTADDQAGMARSERGVQLLTAYRQKQNEERQADQFRQTLQNQQNEFNSKQDERNQNLSYKQTELLQKQYADQPTQKMLDDINLLDKYTGIISKPNNPDLSLFPNSAVSRLEGRGGLIGATASYVAPNFRSQQQQDVASALQRITNSINHASFGARITDPERNATLAGLSTAKPEVLSSTLSKIYSQLKDSVNQAATAYPLANKNVIKSAYDTINDLDSRIGGSQSAEAAPAPTAGGKGPVGSASNPMVGNPNTHQPSLTPQEAAAELARRKSSRGN